MIRGGTLAEPVREVTVASTLQRMLQSILHIGSDIEWLPGIAAGQTWLWGICSSALLRVSLSSTNRCSGPGAQR